MLFDIRHFEEQDGTPLPNSFATYTGATSTTNGISGIVPAPLAGEQLKFFAGDGTWTTVDVDMTYNLINTHEDAKPNNAYIIDPSTKVDVEIDMPLSADCSINDEIIIINNSTRPILIGSEQGYIYNGSTTSIPSALIPAASLSGGYGVTKLVYVGDAVWMNMHKNSEMVIHDDTTTRTKMTWYRNGEVEFPMSPTAIDYQGIWVDWGDGTAITQIDNWTDERRFHTYVGLDTYTMTITGTLGHTDFRNSPGSDSGEYLTEIIQISDDRWEFLDNSFYGCSLTNWGGNTFFMRNVNNMHTAFAENASLTGIPSKFNSDNVIYWTEAFMGCTLLDFEGVIIDVSPVVERLSRMFKNCINLVTGPTFRPSTSAALEAAGMFYNCPKLKRLPVGLSLASSVDNEDAFFGCTALSGGTVGAAIDDIDLSDCNFAGPELDLIYKELAEVVGKTITVTGNPGTSSHTTSIATNKGWTVN